MHPISAQFDHIWVSNSIFAQWNFGIRRCRRGQRGKFLKIVLDHYNLDETNDFTLKSFLEKLN